jgi:hypothetical protein
MKLKVIFLAIVSLLFATVATAQEDCGTSNTGGCVQSFSNDWGGFTFGGFGDGFAGAEGSDYADAQTSTLIGGDFEFDNSGFDGELFGETMQSVEAVSTNDNGNDSLALSSYQSDIQGGFEAIAGNDCEDCTTYYSGSAQISQLGDSGAYAMGENTYGAVEGGADAEFSMDVGEDTDFSISSFNEAEATGQSTLTEGGQALAGSSVFNDNSADWSYGYYNQEGGN